MVDQRGTLTPAEHQVLEFLAAGPALLGPRTETVTVRRMPRLYDALNETLQTARLADVVAADDREQVTVRTVDRKAAARLVKAGLIVVVAGEASLVDEPPT